jgi:hypothetical protein
VAVLKFAASLAPLRFDLNWLIMNHPVWFCRDCLNATSGSRPVCLQIETRNLKYDTRNPQCEIPNPKYETQNKQGVFKCDIGIKAGRIFAIGKAGNPDVMEGVTPGMTVRFYDLELRAQGCCDCRAWIARF